MTHPDDMGPVPVVEIQPRNVHPEEALINTLNLMLIVVRRQGLDQEQEESAEDDAEDVA